MMRLSLFVAYWLFAAAPTSAQLVEYALIAQRPDHAGAVHVSGQADFAACCSAFSASTVSLEFPTPAVRWVQVMVHLTATTLHDAVRLRVYQWRQTADGWSAPSVYSPEMAPALLQAPRTVGFYVPLDWWTAQTGEVFFALEARGSPVLYGAKIRVQYASGVE